MVGTIYAGRAWRNQIRPALVRMGRLAPPREAAEGEPPTPEAAVPTAARRGPKRRRRAAERSPVV